MEERTVDSRADKTMQQDDHIAETDILRELQIKA